MGCRVQRAARRARCALAAAAPGVLRLPSARRVHRVSPEGCCEAHTAADSTATPCRRARRSDLHDQARRSNARRRARARAAAGNARSRESKARPCWLAVDDRGATCALAAGVYCRCGGVLVFTFTCHFATDPSAELVVSKAELGNMQTVPPPPAQIPSRCRLPPRSSPTRGASSSPSPPARCAAAARSRLQTGAGSY